MPIQPTYLRGLTGAFGVLASAIALNAQPPAASAEKPAAPESPAAAKAPPAAPPKDNRRPDDPFRIAEAVSRSVEILLAQQENMDVPAADPSGRAEWPYEGVYRVGGKIPMGYRIGGTAISATALLRAPGYAGDPKRQEAIARAVRFICTQHTDSTMSADTWDGGYDVRGWGYTGALAFFLELERDKAVPAEPKDTQERVDAVIRWAIESLGKTEIKGVGGWNYAHYPGRDTPCPSSPFMTGPTLQALFEAKKQGFAVDEGVITRALDALERCRGSTGSFAYAAENAQDPANPEPIPGAVGRMLVGEVTLYLAGRSDLSRVRGALDAFLAHWAWLDQRRAKPGTHEGPYHIAPYYFYYAHYYAAQAIELLPRTRDGRGRVTDQDRKEYRRRLAELLFSVRQDDGSWNDRVFPRTSGYGTSMAAMGLLMPMTPAPARFTSEVSPTLRPQ